MKTLILLVCLMYVNAFAEKNWIKIHANNSYGHKVYKPTNSYKKPRYKKSTVRKKTRLIDQKLINSIRHVQNISKRYK